MLKKVKKEKSNYSLTITLLHQTL